MVIFLELFSYNAMIKKFWIKLLFADRVNFFAITDKEKMFSYFYFCLPL